jgi:hypothetical protein
MIVGDSNNSSLAKHHNVLTERQAADCLDTSMCRTSADVEEEEADEQEEEMRTIIEQHENVVEVQHNEESTASRKGKNFERQLPPLSGLNVSYTEPNKILDDESTRSSMVCYNMDSNTVRTAETTRDGEHRQYNKNELPLLVRSSTPLSTSSSLPSSSPSQHQEGEKNEAAHHGNVDENIGKFLRRWFSNSDKNITKKNHNNETKATTTKTRQIETSSSSSRGEVRAVTTKSKKTKAKMARLPFSFLGSNRTSKVSSKLDLPHQAKVIVTRSMERDVPSVPPQQYYYYHPGRHQHQRGLPQVVEC